jgi:uncharacterized membrane protein YedE/YeeE
MTPWLPLLGGALIGLSASLLLLTHGRITGISGFVGTLLQPAADNRRFRVWFLAGLLAAGLVARAVAPAAFGTPRAGIAATIIAGLLVGYGTRLGNGCTSGHGVCGVSRLSRRSIVATLTFCATGAATVALLRLVGGGQ